MNGESAPYLESRQPKVQMSERGPEEPDQTQREGEISEDLGDDLEPPPGITTPAPTPETSPSQESSVQTIRTGTSNPYYVHGREKTVDKAGVATALNTIRRTHPPTPS